MYSYVQVVSIRNASTRIHRLKLHINFLWQCRACLFFFSLFVVQVPHYVCLEWKKKSALWLRLAIHLVRYNSFSVMVIHIHYTSIHVQCTCVFIYITYPPFIHLLHDIFTAAVVHSEVVMWFRLTFRFFHGPFDVITINLPAAEFLRRKKQ